ncbi:MAG TPA: hypothetical protein PKV21_05145 [bacterium]|nr:hypothetical protein [bacterium]HOM26874.1 hypothetical protein [bacterium]
MEKTIKVINELKKKGLINDYAIGGGIGALFYIEPFLTYDLDIFVVLKEEPDKVIIDLSNIYNYLQSKGYKWKGEHILIEGVPVQFIVADELEEEGIKNAKKVRYKGIPTKVLSPEYLIAIFLRTGRKKDIEKVERFFEETKINKRKLRNILKKFNIKWVK